MAARVPAKHRKGRLQAGMDADVVVFDAETISDRASYARSTLPSAGIRHVLVNGTFVVRDGAIVADAKPGRPVRAEPPGAHRLLSLIGYLTGYALGEPLGI